MSRIATGTFDGPWVEAFWFELPGTLRSKSNARRFSRDGKVSAKERRAYEAEQAFAKSVKMVAGVARPRSWELGPSGVNTLAQRPQIVTVVAARSTLDATNVPKTLHDVCEGIVFHNDASVRSATQVTVRGAGGGGVVAFARLAPDATLAEVTAAQVALIGLLVDQARELVAGFAA